MTQPPSDLQPLDYATPRRGAGGFPFIAQMAVGFGAFVVAASSTVVIAVLLSQFADSATGSLLVLGAVYGIPVVLLTALSIVAWRRWHWRGVLVGVLVGLGLLLMAVGLCFAIVPTLI